ncbi:MAG: hypothetical protein D6710_09190 [Nitrospirae bacterium]|nr:MAG: hypothetical protein D6710_09190 [Nitrospirota bacterium]
MIKAIFKVLSSWWTATVWLIVMVVLFIVTALQAGGTEAFFRTLFLSTPGRIAYATGVLNMFFISLRVLTEAFSSRVPSIQEMDTWIEFQREGWQRFREGFKEFNLPAEVPEKSAYIKLRRWSVIPGTLLRAGFVVLLLALMLSYNLRVSEKVVLHKGALLELGNRPVRVKAIEPDMSEEFLQVGEKSTFKLSEVSLLLDDGDKIHRVGSGFPSFLEGHYLRVIHLGLYQELKVKDGRGEFSSGYALDVFPPGKTAVVTLPERDYFLTLTLYPERTIKKGILTGRQYNLKELTFKVLVQKNKKILAEGLIKEGQTGRLAGWEIGIPKGGYYAELLIVKDPVYPLLLAGLGLLLSGLFLMPVRFFWFKKELLFEPAGELIRVGYSEEFYKRWAVNRFHRLFDDLSIV